MTFPPDAVCAADGCDLPPAGVRPSQRDINLEDDHGNTYAVLPAGEADEVVCAQHADGPQPPYITALLEESP